MSAPADSSRVSEGFALLHSPRELWCPLPTVMGRVPPAAGEGVLLGDKKPLI